MLDSSKEKNVIITNFTNFKGIYWFSHFRIISLKYIIFYSCMGLNPLFFLLIAFGSTMDQLPILSTYENWHVGCIDGSVI